MIKRRDGGDSMATSIHRIEGDEIFDKASAMVKLMSELNAGFTSGDESEWISDAEVDNHFKDRRSNVIV